jgi:hypothetical protein
LEHQVDKDVIENAAVADHDQPRLDTIQTDLWQRSDEESSDQSSVVPDSADSFDGILGIHWKRDSERVRFANVRHFFVHFIN